jgi:hypothetical protein
MDMEAILNDKNRWYFDKEGNRISLKKFGELFEDPEYKIIKQEKIGDSFVSTVWLGLDMSNIFTKSETPKSLFETMIFKQKHEDSNWDDLYMERCGTKEQAVLQHEEAVKWVKEKLNEKD